MPSADAVVLPENVRPVHYQITLQPDMDNFTFDGLEVIDIDVKEATSEIVLNAADLKVPSAFLMKDGRSARPTSITLDEDSQTVTLAFAEPVEPGQAQLDLRFTGKLNDRLHGFYRSQYVNPEGEVSYLATTQFEATDARRAFPCWDEPACKATFQLTLNIPADMVAVSNTPLIQQAGLDAGYKSIMFGRTPIMSTYLMAFVVGDLTYIEQEAVNNTTVGVWTTRGKEEQGRFALDTSARMLSFFNDYFGIPYPLEKLDHIAIPDFAAGAMENWGCITYRETALLVDPENSSAGTRQRVAEVVAHEMAHMWFGDLVTMEWWDDLWLNESFASWMGTKATDWAFPEWEMWTQFVNMDTNRALSLDGLKNSHPIEQEVKDPAEISQLFDAISYSKGASVIRMLEQFLTPEVFQQGLHQYLDANQYSNARTEHLWAALEDASNLPVTAIMNTWTGQMGYPVLRVETRESGDQLELALSQERFVYDNLLGESEPEEMVWQVPVGVTQSGSGEGASLVMDTPQARIQIPQAAGGESWFKVNPSQTGFFRVNYSEEDWQRLIPAIGALTLPATDRLGIQNDAYALSKAGLLPVNQFLDIAAAYQNETDASVWSDLASNLRDIDFLLADEPCNENFRAFARELFGPAARRIGWDAREGEGHLDALLTVHRSQPGWWLRRPGISWPGAGTFRRLSEWLEHTAPRRARIGVQPCCPGRRSADVRSIVGTGTADRFAGRENPVAALPGPIHPTRTAAGNPAPCPHRRRSFAGHHNCNYVGSGEFEGAPPGLAICAGRMGRVRPPLRRRWFRVDAPGFSLRQLCRGRKDPGGGSLLRGTPSAGRGAHDSPGLGAR